jgi:DNA-binding GntR family transcriptional regulator
MASEFLRKMLTDQVIVLPERTESSARRIEREIRKAIVTLELLPGATLSEKETAERYGVSRQPVREAFIALARARLVDIQPRSGTTVVKISTSLMLEARFIRESLERAVVRRACERFDARVRTRLDYLLEAQEWAARADEHYEFQRADEDFHAGIAEGAGCPSAWQVIGDIKSHLERVCHLTLPNASSLNVLISQHRAILAGIDARDADAAEAALHVHLSEILAALPEVAARHASLFSD